MKKNEKQKLDRRLKILRPLQWCKGQSLGRGCIVNLKDATPVMVEFLRLKYLENPRHMKGDIEYLFHYPGRGHYPEEETPFGKIRYKGE
ncbi:MAG: hypothetical protein COB85_02415 [Bacteroidetes bacterium]|nr:MAG: hypothetical protein COB85_02415 [Bacteroidota bacterium]